MVNLDASAPTHFLLSRCFSQLHHLIYQKQLCWPATHSTHLFSVVRLLCVTPINLITLDAPIVYFLQPGARPPLYSAGCLHGHSTGTAPRNTWLFVVVSYEPASISYFDYYSLVEGVSPPSSQGLPSLPTALFRQKGRLTKTLTSKQWQFFPDANFPDALSH